MRRKVTPIRQRNPLLVVAMALCLIITLVTDVIALSLSSYQCAAHTWNVAFPMAAVCTLYVWRAIHLVFSSRLARHRVRHTIRAVYFTTSATLQS